MKTLFSLIIMAAAIGIFMFFTNDHFQNIKTLRTQAAEYDRALTQSKALLAQRDTLKQKYDSISQDNLDKIKKLAPDSVDNVRLIIDINGIATRRGMTIRGVKIQSGGSSTSKQGSLGPDNNPYGSIVLSFSVTAPYDVFKSFLKDLERSLRIVDVQTLAFTASDKTDVYDYSVTLKTYWLR